LLTGERGDTVGFAVVTLIAEVGAPVVEELFFRGLIRTALTRRLGPHGAIWAQAVLFAFAHFGEATGWANVSVLVALGLLGVVLGYTAWLTNRLGAGMVAHGLFNLTAALVILIH
jgi:membrane protease YdiL (CAAX protease family)